MHAFFEAMLKELFFRLAIRNVLYSPLPMKVSAVATQPLNKILRSGIL